MNPRHMMAVPGRKTDVKDSEWLADLLRHGLLRASFVPPQPIRALRELTRYRKRLIQERAQQANRLQKVLEAANIKLATVASDVLGTSAREMVEALIAGETDVAVIASHARSRMRAAACAQPHARSRMRAKIPQLQRALTGRLQPHHRFLLRAILTHIDFLQLAVSQVTQEIAQRLQPYDEAVRLLQSIPGVKEAAAATIVAEIGVDMTRFPSAKHLASWAGVCPGNKQSGGKRMAETTTNGSPWLRAMLGEIAWSISHTRDNYLAAQYRRLSKRLGPHEAAVALAHSVLVVIYHLLRNHTPYTDLGADYFDRVDAARLQQHHVRHLEQLGYTVTLSPSSTT